jgi:hypothetical protein
MQSEKNIIEYKKTEAEKEVKSARENLFCAFHGVRAQVVNPIPACERIDKMFGSGGEAIVHYMWFEQGLKLFEHMLQNSPDKTKEALLKELVDIQPLTGWGATTATIIRHDPPTVEINVKNSPVKTVKGSQKHLIGSFWTGVFTRYFNKQLTCKDFSYDAGKDEFSCLITRVQNLIK